MSTDNIIKNLDINKQYVIYIIVYDQLYTEEQILQEDNIGLFGIVTLS